MRTKTPLVLIEQSIMLLVFALSAALCLRAFIWADNSSRENALRDAALLQAQNMAETLKSCRGDFSAAAALCGGEWDGEIWLVPLKTEDESCCLYACPREDGLTWLGSAEILLKAGQEERSLLHISWQEVTPDE